MTELQRLESYAAQGDVESQFKLGMLYEEGRRVPRNEAKGLALIQQAAEQGAAFASNTLSTIYMARGDFTTGLKWLQRAAEQGLANAQGQLGIFYFTDKIVPQDDVNACAWLTVAAANDCPGGSDFLEKLLSKLNAQQKADVQKLAAELLARLPKISFRDHAETVGLM
jgi:TPR repeat protein